MRLVRLKLTAHGFVRNQKLSVFRESEGQLWLKGMNMDPMARMEPVVRGPFSESDVEEYVPEPPEKTVAEKLKGLWP